MNKIITERSLSSDYLNNSNSYTKKLSTGAVEYYSKEFYNPDFTRKYDDLENIKKEILIFQINCALK